MDRYNVLSEVQRVHIPVLADYGTWSVTLLHQNKKNTEHAKKKTWEQTQDQKMLKGRLMIQFIIQNFLLQRLVYI